MQRKQSESHTPKRSSGYRIVWRLLWLAGWSIFIFYCLGIGIFIGAYTSVAPVVGKLRDIAEIRISEGTRIVSADGQLLGRIMEENREFIPLHEIPQDLKSAIIATEDAGFYQHPGINLRGIARAMKKNVLSGQVKEGGSTITQQLARNAYELSTRRSLQRKIQEFMLALEIERRYTKDEILELYLNEIYFGERSYGIKVAAKTYFGKDPDELTLTECATLAGLPKAPSYYNPHRSLDRAIHRRNVVLNRMVDAGYLDRARASDAKMQPLKLAAHRPSRGRRSFSAPYFCAYVLKQAEQEVGADAISRGGLVIQTTLNWEMQQDAERILVEGVERAKGQKVSQGALVAVDAQTGAIKAMVGGVNYRDSEFNRATQGNRQTGSAFKPFVYITAIDNGKKPDDRIRDSYVKYPDGRGGWWAPDNYDGKYYGWMTLKKALTQSRNIPAVKLLDEVGINSVIKMAERMGLHEPMYPNLALALGAGSATPLEMASAYSVIANGGFRAEPYAILKIEDAAGGILLEYKPAPTKIIPESTTQIMSDMMAEVVTGGTAAGAFRRVGRLPFTAHGKTGTTSDWKDAWFVGWGEGLSCAVWVGNDQPVKMRKVTGGSVPADIWMRFMKISAPAYTKRRQNIIAAAAVKDADREFERMAEKLEEPLSRSERQSSEQRQTENPDPDLPRVDLDSPNNQDELPPEENSPEEDNALPAEERTERTREQPQPARQREETVMVGVCAVTGKRATHFCPRIVLKSYPKNNVPTSTCALHPDPYENE